ncbi:MAG: ABC transporter substrate-binding protein [archaeon]|jgi:branched-chain amino acid transport system substrate-binding protein
MNKKIILGITIIIVAILLFGVSLKTTGLFTATQENEKVTINAILPLTGINSMYGEAQKNGIDLALEELNTNAKGSGLIEVNYEDNQSDPKVAVNAAQKILTQNPKIIISTMTPTTTPLLSLLKDKNIILLIGGSISASLAPQDKYFFKDHADVTEWANTLTTAVKEKYFTKTALVYFQTDQGEAFAKQVNKSIIPILVEKFDPTTADFKTITLKIKESGADSIVFAGFPKNAGAILKELEETDTILPTFLINANWPEVTANNVGSKIQPFTAGHEFDATNKTEKAKEFTIKFKAKYNKEPTVESAIIYDTIMLLGSKVKLCKNNNECIAKELASTHNYVATTGKINYDENRNSSRASTLLQYKDGKWVETN